MIKESPVLRPLSLSLLLALNLWSAQEAVAATTVVGGATSLPTIDNSLYPVMIDVQGKVSPTQVAFAKGSGFGGKMEVTEHKIISPTGQVLIKELPGRKKYLPFVIRRPIGSNLDFSKWRKEVEDGNIAAARANITFEANGIRWYPSKCWPTQIRLVMEQTSTAPLEELTLACDDMY